MIKFLHDTWLVLKLPFQQLHFRLREIERFRALDNAIAAVRKNHTQARNVGLVNYERLWNVCLYFLLFEHDLNLLRYDAVTALTDRRRRFIAQNMATLLYEATDDLKHLLGKDFRSAVQNLGASKEEMQRLGLISRCIRKFGDQYSDRLSQVRNLVGAHKDHDAAAQLEALDALDLMDLMRVAVEFYEPARQLFAFLHEFALAHGGGPEMLRQVLNTPGAAERLMAGTSNSD